MGPARAARLALIAALCAACAHTRAGSPARAPLVQIPPPAPAKSATPARAQGLPAEPGGARSAAEVKPRRKMAPTSIPRAGGGPLDPAARGEAFAWPAFGVLISGFGARERDRHDGIDLAAPEGTNVVAAAAGVVLFAGEQRGYGNLILLSHEDDVVTVYAHNAQNLVVPGEKIAKGEVIARIGRTGNATGPHLHFEVRVAARPRDPLGFLR